MVLENSSGEGADNQGGHSDFQYEFQNTTRFSDYISQERLSCSYLSQVLELP